MLEEMVNALSDYIVNNYSTFAADYPTTPTISVPAASDISLGFPDSTMISKNHIRFYIEFEEFINIETENINGDLEIEFPVTVYLLFDNRESEENLNTLLLRHADCFTTMIGTDPTLDGEILDSEIIRFQLYKTVEGNSNVKGIEFKITLKDEFIL